MSALDELRAGAVGLAFVGLLTRTVRAVALARGFPPPDGRDEWDSDAVATVVAEFFADNQTKRRLTDLSLHCRSDQALARRLQQTVRNFLADGGRRTPVGRLVLRINEVLGQDPGFELRGRRWGRAGSDAEPAPFDLDALVVGTAAVEVVVPRAWSSGGRQSPEIDAASVVHIATTILEAAGGPLRAAEIAQVVARRLGLGAAPLSLEASAFDPPAPAGHAGLADVVGDLVVTDVRAADVFGLFNDAERIAIGLPDLPVVKLGPLLGVSASKAALIRKRAVAILEAELRDEEGGQAVANAVLGLAHSWTESWMEGSDPT